MSDLFCCPKRTAVSNPHTSTPMELHVHNNYFISGKPCKQLRTIFKAVRNSREKKLPSADSRHSRQTVPRSIKNKTKGILKAYKRVNETLRGQKQQECNVHILQEASLYKQDQSFQTTLTQFSAVGLQLPRCKVRGKQLISEGMQAGRGYDLIRCLFTKVKPTHNPNDASYHMLSSAPSISNLLIQGGKGVPVLRNLREMCFPPNVATVSFTHL